MLEKHQVFLFIAWTESIIELIALSNDTNFIYLLF